VAGDTNTRALTDLFHLGGRRVPLDEAVAPADPVEEPTLPSMALPKFLGALSGRPNPNLIDLGPVVGSNITFFGERLGCKIFIEDVYLDIERAARTGHAEGLPGVLEERFSGRDDTVDGVLCWDAFDHLDKPAAQVLARQLVRIVRRGGAVLGFFGTTERERAHYTKFVIVEDDRVRHRTYAATAGRTRVLLNRDIIRMFDGLQVVEQFLLKSNTREILFRKA
jgi:hypothetical protein